MADFISASDVRNRLALSSVEVSDTVLASPSFIPYGEAWMASKLGVSPATLDSTRQAFAKAAEIAFVAMRVVTSAPLPGVTSGPLEIKPISSQDKTGILAVLKAECKEALEMLGVASSDYGSVRTVNYAEY
ncbi:MAG TPA: hypothetical protein PLG20_08880 [Candidatus Syntrophosphaera sp.]|nr:hypothetical protein [Candidatus Syntrophosphaera sp.]